MPQASPGKRLRQTSQRLAELLTISPDALGIKEERTIPKESIDWLISHEKQLFAIKYRRSGDAASMMVAIRNILKYVKESNKKVIPVIVVPYMGDIGHRICAEEKISWLDLSGNAHLVIPGLRVQIEGKPNRFKRAGRPTSLFAPKSARITRCLLMQWKHIFTQRELARLSGLDEGFTSRIVRGLEEQRLITRLKNGSVRVQDYNTLLDAWHEAYDFSKHQIVRGHIAARSSDEVLQRLVEQLQHEKIEYAVTGLTGAWFHSGFAEFRLVTLYVAEYPNEKILEQIGFHESEKGENVWLVLPNDSGVFQGGELRDDITCVHPVQVYMDLKGHPERSSEAAYELRKKLLKEPTANV